VGLVVSLLGPPRVEVDGQPLVLETRKATARLALLVFLA
jgi:DNA-binding SARP family transcriptional activator